MITNQRSVTQESYDFCLTDKCLLHFLFIIVQNEWKTTFHNFDLFNLIFHREN